MAINIQTTIKTFYPAHNDLLLQFIMDDLGTAPNAKWFTSYIENEAAERLTTKNEAFHPISEVLTFERNLKPITRSLVNTKIPLLEQIQSDTEIIKAIRFKYGTVTLDAESTPCSTTEDINLQTDLFYVINSRLQQNELTLFEETSPVLLQSRASSWKLVPGQHDFFWLLGAGKLQLQFYDRSGTLVLNHTHDFSDNDYNNVVTVVGINPELYSLNSNDISKITVNRIHYNGLTDTLLETYNIYFDHNKCVDTDYLGLLYLDPKGGRCALPLSILEKTDLILKSDEIIKQFDYTNTVVDQGLNTSINISSKIRKTFSTQLTYTENNEKILMKCLGGAGRHLQKYKSSDAVFEKCIIESATYTIYKKNKLIDVSINVILSEENVNQGQDI